MDWDRKWKHEFSEETSKQCAEYYFNAYAENWERDEVKSANQSIPGIMQWDDHDIFGFYLFCEVVNHRWRWFLSP
jgi:phosphodiesterase/alkaline phosphatase D-like protein